jgi:hypothetical protein
VQWCWMLGLKEVECKQDKLQKLIASPIQQGRAHSCRRRDPAAPHLTKMAAWQGVQSRMHLFPACIPACAPLAKCHLPQQLKAQQQEVVLEVMEVQKAAQAAGCQGPFCQPQLPLTVQSAIPAAGWRCTSTLRMGLRQ